MSSTGVHVSRNSARRLVHQLHHHLSEQRQTVMECRNRAEAMSASGIARAAHVGKVAHPSPLCFVEVASEKDVKQNFIPYGALSGIAVAVSDALDVQEFHTRSGLDTPMFHHVARKEFPLVSWLRRQGALVVGKMSCRTPFALSEGTVFGPDKPAALAVTSHACDYAISCSLNGPASVLCAVEHDMVGFKPTSQTFGTFTERFELTMPSMTVGLSARRVDDLMFLWQVYTASIDPEAYFDTATTTRTPSTATTVAPSGGGGAGSAATAAASDAPAAATAVCAPEGIATAAPAPTPQPPAVTAGELREGRSAPSTAAVVEGPAPSAAHSGSNAPAKGAAVASGWWSGKAAPAAPHPDDKPKYARPDILDHNPYNYTVRDRHGHIADIDVGWRDYNAEAAMADDFNLPSQPGFFRRLFTGAQTYERPQVELAVGYPADWIDKYCTGKYASAAEFHQRLTDAVYMHSALHYNQKLEIVPLAFDFSLEEVMDAVTVIAHYEFAKSFERFFAPSSAAAAAAARSEAAAQAEEAIRGSRSSPAGADVVEDGDDSSILSSPENPLQLPAVPGMRPIVLDNCDRPAAPNRPNSFAGLSGVLEELPATLVESILTGQKLTARDYNRALRVRDDVVRATEEQFMDVDCFVTPLLSDPYRSGDIHSVRLTLPFQLAGNPILSAQVDAATPVALIGELGRDAALMEDAFCFLQFVRGASPRWWRQKVFGEGPGAAMGGATRGSSPHSTGGGSSTAPSVAPAPASAAGRRTP